MMHADVAYDLYKQARSSEPVEFSLKEMETRLPAWEVVIAVSIEAHETTCTIKTPFLATSCEAQTAIVEHYKGRGFKVTPVCTIVNVEGGVRKLLMFHLRWEKPSEPRT